MSESENVKIEIDDNNRINDNVQVAKEWYSCLIGNKVTKRYERQRNIEKVPLLLLKGEKGHRNREFYEPAVVSLGIYHHNRTELAHAEKYKLITLEEFSLSCRKTTGYLYNKVFEVVEEARNCYIDGSTDGYSDEEFTRIMLRFANVVRDIFLLENQIPFVVLEVLLKLRFPTDEGEDLLNRFFNYLNYGEVMIREEKVLENKEPLHLLELYRCYFISLKVYVALDPSMGQMWSKESGVNNYNYVKRNRSLASVMELKAKGIFLKCMSDESSDEGIKFLSHCCYGELKLVPRAVSLNTKAIYLNMIAYEMCAHNANDLRVSTYIRVMKSLVIQRDDVKELLKQNILIHGLGRDEDVVKLYDEIELPTVNLYMFNQLRLEIEKHCKGSMLRRLGYMCKSWWAELITMYFSSPWKTVAFLVGSAILVFTFLQTYFTIKSANSG
ncbi:hypothetical protein M8C21_009071 [Ambrosia artemisiifolia]|uniref:Uncharacterized protein n=1 Tax=Ambrosia artemisiifolia TaxID=4212 RepID=A0AAD5GV53_AMBAR|nr:hypothetical protein M8C21_009071 [Ambrosia artemisiifolia]